MSVKWYYMRQGVRYGPVGGPELRKLAANGQVLETDLVWRSGLGEWVPAGRVAGLFGPPPPCQAPAVPPPSDSQSVPATSVASGQGDAAQARAAGKHVEEGARAWQVEIPDGEIRRYYSLEDIRQALLSGDIRCTSLARRTVKHAKSGQQGRPAEWVPTSKWQPIRDSVAKSHYIVGVVCSPVRAHASAIGFPFGLATAALAVIVLPIGILCEVGARGIGHAIATVVLGFPFGFVVGGVIGTLVGAVIGAIRSPFLPRPPGRHP